MRKKISVAVCCGALALSLGSAPMASAGKGDWSDERCFKVGGKYSGAVAAGQKEKAKRLKKKMKKHGCFG